MVLRTTGAAGRGAGERPAAHATSRGITELARPAVGGAEAAKRPTDLLEIAEVARRSGMAASALRYYEREGLITSVRTAGGRRRYERSTLRRLAFIRAAQHVGLSLDEIRLALRTLPEGRTPTRNDWARLSRGWRGRLDEQIEALVALRDGLSSCIGCGCLSLQRCALSNPGDVMARSGPGARFLPPWLRRPSEPPTPMPDPSGARR